MRRLFVLLGLLGATAEAATQVSEPQGRATATFFDQFKDSGIPESVAVVVSVGALYLSLMAHVREVKRLRVEERLRRKAEIRAKLLPGGRTSKHIGFRLVIENFGPSTGENLRVELDGKSALDADCIRGSRQIVPSRLLSKDDCELILWFREDPSRGVGGANPLKQPRVLSVYWTDQSGEKGEYQKSLRFEGLPVELDLDEILKIEI